MKCPISASRPRLRVLILGEDPDVQWLFDREIKRLGHLLVRARDAARARTIMAEGQVALAIVEDTPGDEESLALVQHIRHLYADTEVVLYTSSPSHERAFAFGKFSVAAYLVKPFTDGPPLDEVLADAVARYVQMTSGRGGQEKQDLRMTALARFVDQMPMGIVLVDAQRRVLLANQTAQEILDEGNGLWTNENKVLEAKRSEDNATMQRLINAAMPSQLSGGFPTGGATTIKRGVDRPPLCLMVGPLEMALESEHAPDSVVVVVITDPEQALEPREKFLCSMYGLSPKQAQFGAKLMQGRSVFAASEQMKIEVSTGRSHLKALYRKTDTSHQAELVSLLWSSPATIRLGNHHKPSDDKDSREKKKKGEP